MMSKLPNDQVKSFWNSWLPDEYPDEDSPYWEVKGYTFECVLEQYPWKKDMLRPYDNQEVITWKITRAPKHLAKKYRKISRKHPGQLLLVRHWSNPVFDVKGICYEFRADHYKDDYLIPDDELSILCRSKCKFKKNVMRDKEKRKLRKIYREKDVGYGIRCYGPPIKACYKIIHDYINAGVEPGVDDSDDIVQEGKMKLPAGWFPYIPSKKEMEEDEDDAYYGYYGSDDSDEEGKTTLPLGVDVPSKNKVDDADEGKTSPLGCKADDHSKNKKTLPVGSGMKLDGPPIRACNKIIHIGDDDGVDDGDEEGKMTLPDGWIPYIPSKKDAYSDDDDAYHDVNDTGSDDSDDSDEGGKTPLPLGVDVCSKNRVDDADKGKTLPLCCKADAHSKNKKTLRKKISNVHFGWKAGTCFKNKKSLGKKIFLVKNKKKFPLTRGSIFRSKCTRLLY